MGWVSAMFTDDDITQALKRWDAFVSVQRHQEERDMVEGAAVLARSLGLEEEPLDYLVDEVKSRVPEERAPATMFGVLLALTMHEERDQRIIREHESEIS